MANPITKILHFSTEIQNVHPAGTLIEAVDCGSVTLPLPSDDYIQFTLSDIANSTYLDFNRFQGEDTVIEGSITIDYGDGERDVISAWEVFNGRKGILRKTFSELKERTITVFGEIRDMTLYGHGQITSVIVKGMSSINNGSAMFRGLGGMTSCDVSEFDTKNITNFEEMFYGCDKVATLDVSSFDTSKSTTFHRMFSDNEVLESINLSNFVTSKAENMSFMFDRCFLLTTLNLASFDTSEVLYMQSMFAGCRRLTGLNLSSFNTSKVTNMSSMFASAFMSNPGNVAPEGITFGSNFNTSEVKNMHGMFNHCAVASLDLSQFDTSKVESMQSMFSAGYGLQSLNVSSFDTSSVVTMTQMFENCVQLTSLNLEHFDTRKVTNMQSMFDNAAALSNLQISSWDTRSVGGMSGMFRNAFKSSSSNVTLDLSMWDVRVVGSMDQMFMNTSSKLTNVFLENWCVPLIDSKPELWNGNDQYGTAPAFSQEPTWGDTECAYCCPDNYEYLITTGSSTSTSFELTLDSGSTEVVFVYSGFDDGGKLCVNFEQPDGSVVDEDEEFKDVSINGTVVGTVTKLLKNGADNNIIHYTNSDGCFSGEYKDDSGTVIMTEVNAPTPTPVGSISEFTAENLCQYESGRFEDFSGSYICVNKPLTNWNNPTYKYIRFIENGLYEYDGMVNGKPSYKLENEYGVSKIEYLENYDSNSAGYHISGSLNDELTELSQENGGYEFSVGHLTNAGSRLRPKTEWKTYNSRKNKEYPWCHGANYGYTLVTDPDECVILDPTPTPTPEQPTPTPTSQPDLGGDDVNELEFRWTDGIVADEKILQVRNLLKPTHSDNGVGNFDDRDMSDWSTLYTSNQNEDNHDLSSAFWPDAAVDENYSFAKTIDFENVRIILDDTDLLPNNELSNLNYYQLYIDFDNSNADLHPVVNSGNTLQPLYIYHGDTDNPSTLASGATDFNSVITKMATATSTSESTSGTKVIQISNSDTTKFKAGMNVIISPDNDAIREENVIESLGSLNLQTNLQNTHPQGSQVIQKPGSPAANGVIITSTTPTPTSSPSPNECDGLSAKRCYSPYAGWNYVRSTPSANGNCYRGCTRCEDDTRQCGAETKEEFGPPQKRSYNLGCGFPECECNETDVNGWAGPQFAPNPQDKEFRRVNETECEPVPPTCDQAFKNADEARAAAACQDGCNGVAVEWNDDICAWECLFTECDNAKVTCLEQKAPDCDQTGETKTLNKPVNPNTCEYEDCECIDLDNNNNDHKCFDNNGNFTGMKTLNDQCEFEDCCEEKYIQGDCVNNKVKKINTDCTEGPCECVKDEVDDPGCGQAAVGHGPQHSVWDEALCKYTCECDWDFIEAQAHNVTMIADCNATANKKVFRNENNCNLECICDAVPCPGNQVGDLNNDTCEYENCECIDQPDNTTQMCADGTTQQTWNGVQCEWTPDCPDVACGSDQHPEWKLPNGDPCNPSQATLKTFFGLSMNLNNEWENVFDGLSIKFGEQETANGVDYLPIYAKVDNDKIALSSGDNISEWNQLFIFVGDNVNSNTLANGEGMEFDTIISDDLMLIDQHTNSISAKIHFRFTNINGISTLQIKNIKKPTHSVFENRDTENDWSSVYVGIGYNLNDNVWPTASVDVNYEIGPMTYSSTDCQKYCVDDPTPTPVDYPKGGGT